MATIYASGRIWARRYVLEYKYVSVGCYFRVTVCDLVIAMYAPIALFTFKRPVHTRAALMSLLSNPEIYMSPLYIYCDGARNQTEYADVIALRSTVRSLAPPHAVIVERESNFGVDISIVNGVTELCARYGRVIVVEDDLEVSSSFLAYMNAALDRYESDERVMQISGYMFPVKFLDQKAAVFLPYTTSWGWGIWNRVWKNFNYPGYGYAKYSASAALKKRFNLDGSYPYFKMFKKNIIKTNPAWDIVFYFFVFSNNGVVLHPTKSLVRNNGFDGSGTNCGKYAQEKIEMSVISATLPASESVGIDMKVYGLVKSYLRRESRLIKKIKRKILAYAKIT